MDIYEKLMQDHDEVQTLLNDLIGLEEKDDYRSVLIAQIAQELVPHSRAEESVFYNSIRAVNSDNSDVMHSFGEHAEAETLLRTLQVQEKTEMGWKKTAEKLKEALDHHIQEEEGKIFSEARKIFNDKEAEMMGSAFEKLKGEVKQEGFLKTSFDMVVNLMPPRFVDKVKNLGSSSSSDQGASHAE